MIERYVIFRKESLIAAKQTAAVHFRIDSFAGSHFKRV